MESIQHSSCPVHHLSRGMQCNWVEHPIQKANAPFLYCPWYFREDWLCYIEVQVLWRWTLFADIRLHHPIRVPDPYRVSFHATSLHGGPFLHARNPCHRDAPVLRGHNPYGPFPDKEIHRPLGTLGGLQRENHYFLYLANSIVKCNS